MSPSLLAITLFACGSPAPSDTSTSSTSDTNVSDTSTPSGVTGVKGSIAIVHFAADAAFDELLTIHAVFSNEDGGLLNLVECGFIGGGPCVDTLPNVGETLTLNVSTDFFNQLSYSELTAPIVVAGQTLQAVRDTSGAYSGHSVMLDSFPAGPIDVAWGAPLAPYSDAAALQSPDLMVVSSPNVALPLNTLTTLDETIDLTWTPGNSGEVYLRVSMGDEQQIIHLEDNGHYSLKLNTLNGPGALSAFSLSLGRWSNTRVNAAGNDVVLHALSESWFYGNRFILDGFSPISPIDTCEAASAGDYTSNGDYSFNFSTANLSNTLNIPDENTWEMFASPGKDAFFKVSLQEGVPFSATVEEAGGDPSLYLVNACTGDIVANFVSGVDKYATNLPETLDFTPVVSGDYYLVVDNFKLNTGDVTSLHIEGTAN